MDKKDIRSYTFDELKTEMEQLGQKKVQIR